MGNKNQELECLNRVFKYKNRSKGKVKQFIKELSNYNITESERPDFIFNNENVCIGIEHFAVDHLSQKNKNDKIASNGIIGRKAFEDFKSKCVSSEDISDEKLDKLFEEFIDIICKYSEKALNATYPIFLEAFKHSLNTHLKKTEEYRENLRNHFTGKIYLGFLIEIHAEFGYLFLNNSRGTNKIKQGYVPIFYDIVEIIKQTCNNKLDFIIFCTGEEIYKDSDRVYVVSIKNIENDFMHQQARIYRYAAEDCCLNDFQLMQADLSVKPKITRDNENFNVEFDLSQRLMLNEDRLNLVYYAFYRAYYAKSNNYDFVCSTIVLCLMEVFLKYVAKWIQPKQGQNEFIIQPIFYPIPREILNKEITEFEIRWGVNKNKT